MRYRVHSAKVKPGRWYPSKAEAIRAFEQRSKLAGISPPEHYPPASAVTRSRRTTLFTRARTVLLVFAKATAGCASMPANK